MSALYEVAQRFILPNQHRYAQIEGLRDCNRKCGYCNVPNQYDRERESPLEETFRKIDFLHTEGFRLLTYVGGETLAPAIYKTDQGVDVTYQKGEDFVNDHGRDEISRAKFITRDGLTFYEHTREVVRYAHEKGIVIGIVTNGDFTNGQMIHELAEAGLDTLSFSIHSLTKQQLDERIQLAQIAARAKIIPTINVVLTTKTAAIMPGIAAYTVRNGIPFSFGIVQEKGGGFSKKNTGSLLPSPEEQKKVFSALLRLKLFGFVRPSMGYMKTAPNHYPNNWSCNPEIDSFIHIDSLNNINVCQDVRTGIKLGEIGSLSDNRWRENKRVLVKNCGNCLYQCYYDTQHPDPIGHIPFAGVAMLIKGGRADVAEKWGKIAVELSKKMDKEVDWNLKM